MKEIRKPGTICVKLPQNEFLLIFSDFFLFLLFHLTGPSQVIGLNTNRSSARTPAARPAFRENLI